MHVTTPHRVSHTYTQRLIGEPSAVFPLLCPVREADWLDGWDPISVITRSGVAEPDCVFVTPATPNDAIWYVTQHDPQRGFVEMLKITPLVTACRLTIQLRPIATGSEATVTYTHTSLGPEGDAFVAAFTAEYLRAVHARLGSASEPLPRNRHRPAGSRHRATRRAWSRRETVGAATRCTMGVTGRRLTMTPRGISPCPRPRPS